MNQSFRQSFVAFAAVAAIAVSSAAVLVFPEKAVAAADTSVVLDLDQLVSSALAD